MRGCHGTSHAGRVPLLEGTPTLNHFRGGKLGGSWVAISRVTSRVTILITHIRALITPLITTPEPPRRELYELETSRTGAWKG